MISGGDFRGQQHDLMVHSLSTIMILLLATNITASGANPKTHYNSKHTLPIQGLILRPEHQKSRDGSAVALGGGVSVNGRDDI